MNEADTRSRILAAALSLYVTRDRSEISTADICRAAGVSNGSLFHHFPHKDLIALALQVEGVKLFQARLIAALENRDFAEGVADVVKVCLAFGRDEPARARFMLADGPDSVREAKALQLFEANQALAAQMSAWAGRQMAAGHLRRMPFTLLGAIWLGPALFVVRRFLAGEMEFNWPEIETELIAAALAALSARPEETA